MTKIAINGFGRIGRPVFKILTTKHPDAEIVAINDLADIKTLAHLLRYDSNYGEFEKEVVAKENALIVGGKEIKVLSEKDPAKLPWGELDIDVVLECTGVFRDKESASKHLEAGAQKVIISAPCKSDDIPNYVLGVNADKYKGENLVSMASCTTNCLAPIAKVLNDEFGIERGLMTTVHAYTAGQNLVDSPNKDLRRGRAAAQNIVPTTTGAAIAVTKVIPELEGKLDGMAMRVPVPVVSIVDLVANLKNKASLKKINKLFKEKADGELAGILSVSDKPLVSSDFRQNPHSSIIDLPSTMVSENMVKVLSWYDNEWGYSSRLAEMAMLISSK